MAYKKSKPDQNPAARISQAAAAARKLSGQRLEQVRKRVGNYLSKGLDREIAQRSVHQGTSELTGSLRQYAKGGKLSGSLLNKFGPLGKAIEFVLGGPKRPGVTNQSVQDAIDLLRQVAPETLAPEYRLPHPARGPRPIPVTPVTPPPVQPQRTRSPSGVPLPEASPQEPGGPTILPKQLRQPDEPPPRIPQAQPVPAGQEEEFVPASQVSGIQMIPVDNSSNVYSFGYDPQTKVMRVIYLAASVRGSSVSGNVGTAQGKSRRHRPRGALGRTVTQDRRGMGPAYDYYNVPANIFERFQGQASKGKAVWDLLRVRGTIEGHRYEYSLVAAGQSNILGAQGQVTGSLLYVPRRAVRGGFVGRIGPRGVPGRLKSLLPTAMRPGMPRPRPPGQPNDGTRGLYRW